MFETAILPLSFAGLLFGLLFSWFRLRQLVLLAYHVPFRFWRSYDELYDVAGTKLTYEIVDDDSSKDYADFLGRYYRFQPYAKGRFRGLWNTLAWEVGRDYGIVLATSLILLRGDCLTFIVPFALVQAAYFTYLHFYKQRRLDFFVILMIRTMLPKQH